MTIEYMIAMEDGTTVVRALSTPKTRLNGRGSLAGPCRLGKTATPLSLARW